jgi:transcription elongation factor Elf1
MLQDFLVHFIVGAVGSLVCAAIYKLQKKNHPDYNQICDFCNHDVSLSQTEKDIAKQSGLFTCSNCGKESSYKTI